MNTLSKESQLPDIRASQTQRWLTLFFCAVLVLVVLAVFGRTMGYEFILCDDNVYVYENSHVVNGITMDGFKWACTATFAGNWHPLTWLSHMLDSQWYGIHPGAERWKGPEAGWHHLTNVILHAISTVLLFLALRKMTGTLWRSVIVAMMFAIHPLRAESVAWIAERKDVLSGLFWMLTILAYAWYAKKLCFDSFLDGFLSVLRYLAVFVSLFLGLASKSMLVTLPCVLLLLDYWPLRRLQWGHSEEDEKNIAPIPPDRPVFPTRPLWWLILEKLPLFGLIAGISGVVIYSQSSFGAMTMSDPIPLGYRIANALVSCVAYLWNTIWPENLAFFYPHPAILGKDPLWWTVGQAIAAGLLLAAITFLALRNIRRRPYLSVGWFWYLGTLVPVIGLIQVGIQGMADRYTYIPTIGIYILAVWGATELSVGRSRLRMALQYGTPVLLFVWIVLAADQVATWKDSESVFKHAIDVTKNNYFAHNHYGLVYDNRGDIEKAGQEFHKAVSIAPNYDSANSNYGLYFAKRGELEKSIPYYKKAYQTNPSFYGAHWNLGTIYLNLNRIDDAIAEFQEALKIVKKVSSDSPQYHAILANCYYRKGQPKEALAEWQKVHELEPKNLNAMNEIAMMLAAYPDDSVRNGKEAIQLTEKAIKLNNSRPEPVLLRTLAAAYAEDGRFIEALQTARKALDLAKQQNNRPLVKYLNAEIPYYEVHKPFRLEISLPAKSSQ